MHETLNVNLSWLADEITETDNTERKYRSSIDP